MHRSLLNTTHIRTRHSSLKTTKLLIHDRTFRTQRSQARGRNHRHSLQLCYENTDIEYSTSATVSSASDIVTNNSPGLVGSSGVSVDEYGSGNNTVVVYNAAPGPNTQTAEAFFKSFVPQKLIFTEDRAEFKKQLRMRTEILANLVGRRKGFRKLKDALLIFSCFGHSRFSFPIENVQHLHNLLHESDRKNFSLLCTDIDYVAYTQSCCGTVERMVKYRQQGKKSHR